MAALPEHLELEIAREGFMRARACQNRWFAGVNSCPYWEESARNAWYKGWWFFFYVLLPWEKLINEQATPEVTTKFFNDRHDARVAAGNKPLISD
jgi:hypothetical protein